MLRLEVWLVTFLCCCSGRSLADLSCDPEYHYECHSSPIEESCNCKNIHSLCDGIPDCTGGEDEDVSFCAETCQRYGYWCDKRRICLHRTQMCDGSKACGKKSEKGRQCMRVNCTVNIETTEGRRAYTRCGGEREQCVSADEVCAASRGETETPCVNRWIPTADDSICSIDIPTTPTTTTIAVPSTPAQIVEVDCSSSTPFMGSYEGAAIPIRQVGPQLLSVCEASLYAHNIVRLNHQDTLPLIYSDTLARAAEEWAVHLANANYLGTSQDTGENVYATPAWVSRPEFNMETMGDAVLEWYSEIRSYNFETGHGSGYYRSFTQVVWRSTTQVGCGIATIEGSWSYKTFIVCKYTPPNSVFISLNHINVGQLVSDAVIQTEASQLVPPTDP